MIKYLIVFVCFVLLTWLNYDRESVRLEKLNNQINFQTHGSLKYKPKGFIYGPKSLGGFNNQLEKLWFLNILAQRTERVLVEKELRPIDQTFGNRVNLSELINRPKYLSNLATVPEREYVKYCGTYSHLVYIPNRHLFNDDLEFVIQKINSLPDNACIAVGSFPSYGFFVSPKVVNWIPAFKELVLPSFEFSSLIKVQADYFSKQHQLEDNNFLSAQFRRGDFKQHCKRIFSKGSTNWAFGMIYEEKFAYKQSDWKDFEKHCYISADTLVSQITQFTSNLTNPVTKVLVLTNANHEEVDELKSELNSKHLEFLRFSPNLELIPSSVKWTITHSLAAEMELAIRGHYWMGNRHSTINSNLIGLRLNKDLDNNWLI